MATQLQLRRGTTAENDVFTGAVGEVTVDTDTSTLRVHDGITTGGFMVDTVVAFQAPTAGNNYTWYRKYSSGWVEQGGYCDGNTDYANNFLILPVQMSNDKYTITVGWTRQDDCSNIIEQTTTGIKINNRVYADTWYTNNYKGYWRVEGMAA